MIFKKKKWKFKIYSKIYNTLKKNLQICSPRILKLLMLLTMLAKNYNKFQEETEHLFCMHLNCKIN